MDRQKLILSMIIALVLALPMHLAAQRVRYKLIDIPMLGGPAAYGNVDCNECAQFINNPGIVVGGADSSIPDPNAPNCGNPDCFLTHAFRWQGGILTDLGTLPGVNFSHATSINARGWATGGSGTSEIDPQTGNPQEHAVLWKGTEIVDLGTLGAGLDSAGLTINNAGEVVGMATVDTTIDPFPLGPWRSPTHAFIWRNGVMQDLGTLGGADSFPTGGCNNERSDLVVGWSFTNSTANAISGLPTQHAFVWDHGTMTDIPTLGGTGASSQCANNRGQVVGQSTLAGDVGCPDFCAQHVFSWEHGTVTDLGTLGGRFSQVDWLNNEDQAVGGSTTIDDESFHATVWKNNRIADLGTLDGDCFSIANSINDKGQIIGQSFSCPDASTSRAVLWDRGSIVDLNTAISSTSALQLIEPLNINDRGEIVGRGLPPGCDNLDLCGRVFVLIPCDPVGEQGCQGAVDFNAQSRSATAIASKRITTPDPQKTEEFLVHLRRRLVQIPGHRTP
jgi:probable HAF family extracellular repeat protein